MNDHPTPVERVARVQFGLEAIAIGADSDNSHSHSVAHLDALRLVPA